MKKEELHNLFQLRVHSQAPEFIIYSKQINERLKYTCEFLFKHALNCNYSLTESVSDFQNSNALKLNYSEVTIPEVFHVLPHSLIFESGINKSYTSESKLQNELIYFHPNTDKCNLGYDIFASVFYFISRYQEWQPFQADIHGRFESANSIQFKNHQHLKPLVNIWIKELRNSLIRFYPQLKFPDKKFQYISTIDIDNLFAFKNKGFVRTVAAILKDCITLNFLNLNRRMSVLVNKTPDPFDIYDHLNALSKKTGIPLFYFFLQRSNTRFDRTIDPNGKAFKPVFEKLESAGMQLGLHPSYFSSGDNDLMKHEFDLIKKKSALEINLSRQHYLRFDIRKTPFQLIKNNVMADFTMGFASSPGYRAATFTPFYFYDFEKEKQTDLLMIPFALMDGAYFIYSKSNALEAETQIMKMVKEVKDLNGIFVSVFHERTFDEVLYPGFAEVYGRLQDELK